MKSFLRPEIKIEDNETRKFVLKDMVMFCMAGGMITIEDWNDLPKEEKKLMIIARNSPALAEQVMHEVLSE